MKKVLVTIASIALALVITGCGMSVMNPVSDPSVTITPADVAPTIQVYPAQVVLSTPSPSPTFTPAPTVVTTPIPVPSASQQSTLPPYTTAPLTPSSLQTPAPALPIITKSPTDETVEEGGSCWFIAKYENATTAVWHFLSPDGQTDLTYESAQNRFLGDELLMDLSVQRIERYYRELLKTPSVDDPDQTIGKSVIEKIHTMLCTAYRQAQRWGYVPRDEMTVVSLARRPKYRSDEREIWTPQQYRTALDSCEHHGLRLWLLLSASCSARIGELLGLQWDCVEFNDDGTASITFRQQLQRMDREGMANSEKFEIYFSFPSGRDSKTVLALCGMKDKTGVAARPRTVYVGTQVAAALKEEKQRQNALKIVHGRHYEDFNIVIAQDMGRPFEEHEIRKKLKKLCEDVSLPVVVPHAMRHLSVTLKLLISGDVKAVQADSGHKDAGMVLNRYSHAMDAERKKMAMQLDGMLYCSGQA